MALEEDAAGDKEESSSSPLLPYVDSVSQGWTTYESEKDKEKSEDGESDPEKKVLRCLHPKCHCRCFEEDQRFSFPTQDCKTCKHKKEAQEKWELGEKEGFPCQMPGCTCSSLTIAAGNWYIPKCTCTHKESSHRIPTAKDIEREEKIETAATVACLTPNCDCKGFNVEMLVSNDTRYSGLSCCCGHKLDLHRLYSREERALMDALDERSNAPCAGPNANESVSPHVQRQQKMIAAEAEAGYCEVSSGESEMDESGPSTAVALRDCRCEGFMVEYPQGLFRRLGRGNVGEVVEGIQCSRCHHPYSCHRVRSDGEQLLESHMDRFQCQQVANLEEHGGMIRLCVMEANDEDWMGKDASIAFRSLEGTHIWNPPNKPVEIEHPAVNALALRVASRRVDGVNPHRQAEIAFGLEGGHVITCHRNAKKANEATYIASDGFILVVEWIPHVPLLFVGHKNGTVNMWNTAFVNDAGEEDQEKGCWKQVDNLNDTWYMHSPVHTIKGRGAIQCIAASAIQNGTCMVAIGRSSGLTLHVVQIERKWVDSWKDDVSIPPSALYPNITVPHTIVKEDAVEFGAALCVAWSPNGSTLAVGGEDDTLSLYKVSQLGKGVSLMKQAVLRGHSSFVSSVQFHPSGEWLATGGWDGRVVIWDAFEYGRQLARINVSEKCQRVLTVDLIGVHVVVGGVGGFGGVFCLPSAWLNAREKKKHVEERVKRKRQPAATKKKRRKK